MLEAYVELDRSREELLEEFDSEVVEQVVTLVDRAEYKRTTGAAGSEAAPEGIRPRPADSDHEPLEGLTATTVSCNLR